MADTLTQDQRSERMGRIRGKDTAPEMMVRRIVHKIGYRYRLHRKDLPGCPDLVFPRSRKVIFVHGCFWHRHPDPKCPLARLPKTRLDFWEPKLSANHRRDERVQAALAAAGWRIFVAWECEIGDKEQLENKLRRFLTGDTCVRSNFSPEPGASESA
ncbi:MAG: DNA mismatch endonuclease Vsr [Pseudomonadota bacterium]|nr:DNA mismatch endonuclease Vsr [Pseudomonadota bacterium]